MSGITNPVARLVTRLGGQNATAKLANAKQSEVWRWVRRGRIPSSRIPTLIAAAGKLTPPIDLEMEDFFDVERAVPRASQEVA